MTHPQLRNPSQVGEFWWDELLPSFGSGDIVDTTNKPNWGKRNKSRKKHTAENLLPRFNEKQRNKYAGGKKPTLVIEFARPDRGESRFTAILSGILFVVEKVPLCNKWRAYAECRSWTTPTIIANNPATALTILCAWPHWFAHNESMAHWGLIGSRRGVGLYKSVHFVLPFGKRKRMPKFFVKELSTKHTSGEWLSKPKSTKPQLSLNI